MRIPKSLEALADHGVIQEVVRPLMSGKEAQIFLVVSEDHYCAAKIYKDAQNRSFKNKADYIEGRKVRNSRDQRAMEKGTKYGKDKDEDTWKATEVEMIYRLREAGVRVPEPFVYIDGVLVMELVVDEYDNPAPRLGDLEFSPTSATEIYQHLIHETARMLCAGIVHGDLSDFNVLLASDGPVIIDFPQAVNAASNQNARSLLLRDVNNLHRFLQRWVPGARRLPYAEEMWSLYESNSLTPETRLTGKYKGSNGPVDTRAVLSLIGDANRDEVRRREALGKSAAGISAPTQSVPARRREYVVEKPAPRPRPQQDRPRSGSPAPRPPRHAEHGPGQRQPDRGPGGPRRPVPGKRPGPPTMPKRGDAVQASTYVSPEARKAKVKALTPRDGSNGTRSGGERANEQHSPTTGDQRSRRRPRGPRHAEGPNQGPPSGAVRDERPPRSSVRDERPPRSSVRDERPPRYSVGDERPPRYSVGDEKPPRTSTREGRPPRSSAQTGPRSAPASHFTSQAAPRAAAPNAQRSPARPEQRTREPEGERASSPDPNGGGRRRRSRRRTVD